MRAWITLVLILVLMAAATRAAAQEESEDIRLSLHRNFGFQVGGRIQGAFTMEVVGREDLVQVTFLIDDQPIAVDREPPFRYAFSTGDFSLGKHTLAAAAITTSGEEIRTPEHNVEFVSAEEGWKTAGRIVVPILGIVLAFTLIGVLGPVVLGRRGKAFSPGHYGIGGGTVCPRCGLPFAYQLLAPNMIVGKLERCPHCSRWALVRRATAQELAAAEARLAADSERGALKVDDQAERTRQSIDESRFER